MVRFFRGALQSISGNYTTKWGEGNYQENGDGSITANGKFSDPNNKTIFEKQAVDNGAKKYGDTYTKSNSKITVNKDNTYTATVYPKDAGVIKTLKPVMFP